MVPLKIDLDVDTQKKFNEIAKKSEISRNRLQSWCLLFGLLGAVALYSEGKKVKDNG